MRVGRLASVCCLLVREALFLELLIVRRHTDRIATRLRVEANFLDGDARRARRPPKRGF